MKSRNALAVEYRTYHLANRTSQYDGAVSSCVAKLVKIGKLQMKVHLFEPKNPIPIIGFLATIKIACDTNRIYVGAALWVLSLFIKETIVNALISRMCAEERAAALTATARYNEVRPQKLLPSYPEVVSYLQKKYETDAAIAKYDATVLS